MSDHFKLYDENTAPQASCAALATTRTHFGSIPNLERVMAGAPALLMAYSTGWDLFDTTSLSPIERQVVYQTANYENECDYCVPWHSFLAKQAQMSDRDLESLRTGAVLEDPKLEALRSFTRSLIHNRGKLSEAELQAFWAAGYDDQQALEVVLGIAIKTMSNFTNSIAGTPLDKSMHTFRWQKPKLKMRSESC